MHREEDRLESIEDVALSYLALTLASREQKVFQGHRLRESRPRWRGLQRASSRHQLVTATKVPRGE